MSAFRTWYITHQDAITWFIIGMCFGQGINSLAERNYTSAAINFAIAGLNFFLSSYKMKL